MGRNLGPLNIKDTYEGLVQITSGSILTDGSGSDITSVNITASNALQAGTAGYASTAGFVSQAGTAGFASQAGTAGFATTATSASWSDQAGTAGFASQAGTAGFAVTASYFGNALITASYSDPTLTFEKGDGTTFGLTISTSPTLQDVLDNGNTATQDIILTGDIQATNITASGANITNLVVGDITGSNATFASASIGYLTAVTGSVTKIGDAYILLNTNDINRYAGIKVEDSGSAVPTNFTASLNFDSLTNDWFYEYTSSGDPDNFGIVMFGPEYGTKGSPTYNTANTLVKANGGHHLLDSSITDDGTDVVVSANISASGFVSASTYYGDGSNLSGIATTLQEVTNNGNTTTNSIFIENTLILDKDTRNIDIVNSGSTNTTTNAQRGIVIGENSTISNVEDIAIGQDNTISSIGNGFKNVILGQNNTISGNFTSFNNVLGYGNVVSGDGNGRVILGYSNTSTGGSYNAILGGTLNSTAHARSVVIGGTGLSTTANDQVVMPNILGSGSIQTGNLNNNARSEYGAVIGGTNSQTNASAQIQGIFVARDANISSTGEYNVVVGGEGNSITNGGWNTAVGGYFLSVQAGNNNIVAGGESNVINGGSNAGMFAGISNTLSHDRSAVIGGTGLSTSKTDEVVVPNLTATTVTSSIQATDLDVVNAAVFQSGLTITGSAVITGSLGSGTLIDNVGTPTASAAIEHIVYISQSEYNALTPDSNTMYVITGTADTILTDTLVSGSLRGEVNSLTIASTTASMDCSLGNYFTLGLANGVDTRLEASNIATGQTINIKITNNATAAGTISFGPEFEFEGGTPFTATAATNAVDIITLVSFDGTSLQTVGVKNFS